MCENEELQFETAPFVVVGSNPETEKAAQKWLNEQLAGKTDRSEIIETMLQAWWILRENKSFTEIPPEAERQSGWREGTKDRTLEIGWLDRKSSRPARFNWLPAERFAGR